MILRHYDSFGAFFSGVGILNFSVVVAFFLLFFLLYIHVIKRAWDHLDHRERINLCNLDTKTVLVNAFTAYMASLNALVETQRILLGYMNDKSFNQQLISSGKDFSVTALVKALTTHTAALNAFNETQRSLLRYMDGKSINQQLISSGNDSFVRGVDAATESSVLQQPVEEEVPR